LTRVDEEEEILSITWMPDGQALTYRHGSGIGSNELKTERKRISVEGGIPTPAPLTLPHPLGQIYYHTAYLHPAGDRLAYTFGKSTTEFWIMEDFLPDDEDTQ
jgi:hypothetical protein